MKLFDSEEEAELVKKMLLESLTTDNIKESSRYSKHIINWVLGPKTYEDVKNFNRNLLLNDNRLFLILADIDEIKGKPQLIHENIQNIPVLRKVEKKISDGNNEIKTKFIDERYDKRYDGLLLDSLSFEFYVYRLINNDKEYFLFSEKKLPNEFCDIRGINISMDDFSDISSSLKLRKISNIFIVRSFESNVKIIPKEELVDFTKSKQLDVDKFNDLVFSHPDGNIYDYTPDFNLLRKAQLLSSKFEGYPLHLFKIGPVGTGKTTEAEVLDYKFNEDQGILEASNSTLKSLVPSFKEKPANLGYIAKCNRVSIIDELMKMVESSMGHDNQRISNYFGQMNMLLEHKDRMIGSGNDNSCRIKATSKICITTNNIGGKATINSHLNIIDPTTMSRMFIWVQDEEEINKIYNKGDLKMYDRIKTIDDDRDSFLTIYDSCQQFLVEFDREKCKIIFNTISQLASGKMRDVWRSRGLHHTILLLDGIVKHRCLFKDYNKKFKPKNEDYDSVERILIHMVKSWDFNFQDEVLL